MHKNVLWVVRRVCLRIGNLFVGNSMGRHGEAWILNQDLTLADIDFLKDVYLLNPITRPCYIQFIFFILIFANKHFLLIFSEWCSIVFSIHIMGRGLHNSPDVMGATQRVTHKPLLVCSCKTFNSIASILHSAFAHLLM